MSGMLGRAVSAAGWLLWAGLGAGLGLSFGLAAFHAGSHTLAEDRWADSVRLGSRALVCACLGTMALAWAGRWLEAARRMRAAKREARRATLLRHSDPVQAAVDENTQRIDGLQRQVSFMASALADVLHQDGAPAADLEATRPMLRLVGGNRSSA
jgi:hypothetical protein